jgi:ligand-binding sensor domain-containing protein
MLYWINLNHLANRIRNFLTAFSLVLCIFLLALISKSERLPIKTYTVADGLQRDTISRIRQDSRGFLWFCTAEGISRFDGLAMTNFTVADGLLNRFVNDFIETKSGIIYVATGKGLVRLNPHGLRTSTENPLFTSFLPDNPKAEKILTLYEDKNNRVLAGTSDGLYKLVETDGKITFEAVQLGEPLRIGEVNADTIYVTSILEDRRGTLWVGTEGSGLFRLAPDGSARRLTIADKLGDNKIADLLETRDGRLWASMRGGAFGGLCLLDAEASENPVKKCYTTNDGLPTTWIPDLLETSDGKFWLATIEGLCQWQGEGSTSVCKTYTAKNGLCDGVISLAEDKDGNLWTGSGCGAKKIARYGFTTYWEMDGLDYKKTNSIFENSAGELFVSTNQYKRSINRFEGDKFSLVKLRVPDDVKYHGWGW